MWLALASLPIAIYPCSEDRDLKKNRTELWLDRHYDPYSGELLGGNDEYDDEFNQWMM